MTLEQEILQVINQIIPTIEKAFTEVFVQRHPGHPNQKVHGNRFGGYAATKESLRRLKGDKEATAKYKERARGKQGLTLEADKIRVGSKKLALPKDGESVSGIGPRFGDKFTVSKTGKNEYKVATDRQTYNVYGQRNPAKAIERYLRFNA